MQATMCRQEEQDTNALINAHNHGTILVMVAWFLACLLALCTATRIIYRCRYHRLRHLPIADDAILIAASLCAIGATVVISTAVDSGLGRRICLINTSDVEQVQIKIFVSTILFVLALSISKCSMLLFLNQVAESTLQRIGVMAIGLVVLLWTLAVMAGIVFECEMPRPWAIWTGKCIPMVPFWIAATTVDIIIDVTLVLLSAHLVWTARLDSHQKIMVTSIFSLRFVLVALSGFRLSYLRSALDADSDPTYAYIPYSIQTQCHSTVSVMLACSLMLKPIINMLDATRLNLPSGSRRSSKHWSGTTIGTPYESYESFGPSPQIQKEPLHRIQRSMSTPTSPATSLTSLDQDILLPEILLPTRYTKAPPRPPPPNDAERPDLTMFTQTTVIQKPPMVTRLGSVRDTDAGNAWERVGKARSLKSRGLS